MEYYFHSLLLLILLWKGFKELFRIRSWVIGKQHIRDLVPEIGRSLVQYDCNTYVRLAPDQPSNFLPEVLGLGYGWLQLIFYQRMALFPVWILIVLVIAKIVATSFTIGSGGSGGVFAPGMVIGGFLGAAIFGIFFQFFPSVDVVDLTIVGMISFFGSVSKAPISVIIMGTEMTGGYSLFFPLMLTTLVAYFVCGEKYSIYSKQVANREMSPAHAAEYEKPVLDEVNILSAVNRDYPHVSPETNLQEAISKIRETKTKSVVVEKDRKLIGLLSIDDIDLNSDLTATKAWQAVNPNPCFKLFYHIRSFHWLLVQEIQNKCPETAEPSHMPTKTSSHHTITRL